MPRNDLLAWLDLELTSVADATHDKITEIAMVLTDQELNVIAEGPDIVINVDPTYFEGISPEAKAIHDANGMMAACAASSTTAEEAQATMLAFLKEHTGAHSAPLCGNSIHVDRHFLTLQMPTLEEHLFYRCIDVSSIKELAKRWAPTVYAEAEKKKGEKPHRARADIYNSIAELKFYRENLFRL